MDLLRYFFFIILSFISIQTHAQPDGKQLLTACEKTLTHKRDSMTAMMCTWYVTPCNCKVDKPGTIPRVCLPENISTETIIQKVVSGLRNRPDLFDRDADYAAADVLSRYYPCGGQS